MSEVQQQMALARQFIERWSSPDEKWSRTQVQVVAMAILYGEQAGLESGAAIAEEAFGRLREAVQS